MKYILLLLLLTPVLSWAQEEPPVAPPPPPPPVAVKVKKKTLPEVVDFPDVEAKFPGGSEALSAFIRENLEYPQSAVNRQQQGKVYLSFIVEKDGNITRIKVERGVSAELDEEAKRVVDSMPNWKPAEAGGKPVASRCRLPIVFQLSETE
ncbi:MAG: energy transducer TonB [Fluviicola sp.]